MNFIGFKIPDIASTVSMLSLNKKQAHDKWI